MRGMTLANAGGRNGEREPNAKGERTAVKAHGEAQGGAKAEGAAGEGSRAAPNSIV